MQPIIETRVISLPRGGELEVGMTQGLIDRIRYQFGLSPDQKIEDDHVRMFVWGSVNSAVDKAELEMAHG
jgi:hypothetical protein